MKTDAANSGMIRLCFAEKPNVLTISRYRFIIAVCLMALLVLLSGCGKAEDASQCSDPDNSDITELSYAGKTLGDYSFLKDYTSLVSLDLSGSDITDLSPISDLSELETLNLSRCLNVTDLSPLASCCKLRKLVISGCDNVDFSKIPGIAGLETLFISDCRSEIDSKVFSDMPSLNSLSLKKTSISELESLPESLIYLDISITPIDDFSFLENLSKLRYLYLDYTAFDDVNLLSEMKALEKLSILGTKIQDYSLINENNFPNLRELVIGTADSETLTKLRKDLPCCTIVLTENQS